MVDHDRVTRTVNLKGSKGVTENHQLTLNNRSSKSSSSSFRVVSIRSSFDGMEIDDDGELIIMDGDIECEDESQL